MNNQSKMSQLGKIINKPKKYDMFYDALKKLNIENYVERILNSCNGEPYHLADYVLLAETMDDADISQFREWFIGIVKEAEETWEQPETVFQHIPLILEAITSNSE